LPSEFTQIGLATTRSLRELRGALECLAQRIAQASLEVVAQPSPGLADDIAGSVLVDGRPCGVIGQASAAVLAHYGLERPVNIATLRFDALLAGAGRTRTSRPLPKFPSVTRDLSLVVDEQVTWRQLADAIAAIDQPMRAGLQYVTTYRGKPIEPGRKSVTITLTYRWEHGTLRGEQVDEQVAAVVAALGQSLKAELRK
jgi:phenylalanyl-tRNA synthetase beta chain